MLQFGFSELILLLLLFTIFLVGYLVRKKMCYNDPLIEKLRQTVLPLDPRINNMDFYASNESYTEDKEKIYLCLKDKNGEYYPWNFLVYVTLHELSHALSTTVDKTHTSPEFLGTFDMLIDKAHKMGIYDPSQPLVKDYC